jgi:hypothetical protein
VDEIVQPSNVVVCFVTNNYWWVVVIYEREIRKYTEKASRKARASGALGSSALQKTDSIR